MTSPRVLLIGYYGKGNFGDDVLVTVTHNIIKRMMPDAEISIIVGDKGGEYVKKMLPDATLLRPARHGHFDLIVHGGGGVFYDFAEHSIKHRTLERVFILLGMRIFVSLEKCVRAITNKRRTFANRRIGLGIGVGTFSAGSPKLWFHSLPILGDLDALWVRDAQSLENLKRFAPAMKAKQIYGSDLAFLTEYWMEKSTIAKTTSPRPRLGIILRDWPGTDEAALRTLFVRLAQHYTITGFIFDEATDPKMPVLLSPYTTHLWKPDEMSIKEFSALIREQDVLLASRAHGAICGACLGVPSVIVNIEPKLEQVHAMLPNASILVAANATDTWETALQKALTIPRETITFDVEKNRIASEHALQKIFKLKILMLNTQLGYGGAETSFIRLANFLSQSMDVTVALFTPDYGKGAYSKGHEPLDAPILLLDEKKPKNPLRRWWFRICKLRQLKQEHDACISFLSGPNTLNAFAGHNHKTIVSLRGPRMHDPNTPKWNRRIYQYILDPITLNSAAKIVSVSSGLCNEVRMLGGPWTLRKTSVISPFVLSEKHFERASEAPPVHYLALKNQPVIVGVGRLSIEKNFQYLIPIFARLASAHRGAKLLLVGDGPMMSKLRELCIKNGITIDDTTPGITSVLFAGHQKNPLAFIGLGKVFALPSGTEGVPNVLLEALATGIPAVAADAAWAARSVLSGEDLVGKAPYPTQKATPAEYGILMPRIDDAKYTDEWVRMLSECLTSDRWRIAYGEKGKQRLSDYEISRVAPKWKNLIHILVNR